MREWNFPQARPRYGRGTTPGQVRQRSDSIQGTGNVRMPPHITIGPNLVGLVGTSDAPKVLRHLTNVSDPALTMAVASLHEHVGVRTNYAAGLRLALDLLEGIPESYFRHVYIVADGEDNVDRDKLDEQIDRAVRLRVRIYCIPIGSTQAGHTFNCDRLHQIAHRTGGKLRSMAKVKELAAHFEGLAALGGRNLGRSVAKVVLVDLSRSMTQSWDRTTKIDGAKFSIIRFLQIEAKKQ